MTSVPSKLEEGQGEQQREKARLHVIIPFPSNSQAQIAYNSLRVDREPKRSQVDKSLSVENHCLVVDLVGPDARSLRLSSNTFFDHLILVQKTIDKFSLDKYGKEEECGNKRKAKKLKA